MEKCEWERYRMWYVCFYIVILNVRTSGIWSQGYWRSFTVVNGIGIIILKGMGGREHLTLSNVTWKCLSILVTGTNFMYQNILNSLTANSTTSVSVTFPVWCEFWALSKQTGEASFSLLLYRFVFSRMNLLVGFYCSAIIGCPCGMERGSACNRGARGPSNSICYEIGTGFLFITFFLKKTVLSSCIGTFFQV